MLMVWLLGEKDSNGSWKIWRKWTRKMECRSTNIKILLQGGNWDQGNYRGITRHQLGAHQLTLWSSASFQLFWIIPWSSEFVCSMAWCTLFLWQEHTKTVLSFGEPVKKCASKKLGNQNTWYFHLHAFCCRNQKTVSKTLKRSFLCI